MKVITKRDLKVVQVVTALIPGVAGITITRYTGHDPNAPEYQLAHVRVPGISDELGVKLRRVGSEWSPIWVSVPGGSKPGEVGAFYAVSTITGTILGQELKFFKRR